MISAGSVTRSVWKPRAPITFDISTSSGPSTWWVKGSCPGPQKPGPVAGKAPIADVHDGDPELLAQQNLKIAEHVAKAGLAGHRDRCPLWKRLLCGNRSSQAEAERGDIAPAEETARDQRVKNGAQLVARVAAFVSHERIAQIQHLHEIA